MVSKAMISSISSLSAATGVRSGQMAAAHETGLQLLELDNNVIPFGVDVVVGRGGYGRLDLPETDRGGLRYKEFRGAELPVRVWRSQGVMRCGLGRSRPLKEAEISCLLPERLLEAMPESPDFPYLKEQYARLAEVLYFDRMTDDELGQFLRYVRG